MDFNNISLKELVQLTFVFIVVLMSSIAGFLRRHKDEPLWRVQLLIGEVISSLAAGFTAFFIVFGITHNDWMSVGAASLFGHLGPVGFDYLTEILKKKI